MAYPDMAFRRPLEFSLETRACNVTIHEKTNVWTASVVKRQRMQFALKFDLIA